MKRVLKNKLLTKLVIIVIVMIIIGILYISILSSKDRLLIKNSLETFFKSLKVIKHSKILINNFSINIISISLVFILSMSIIGIPIIITFLSYKSFVLGFTISSIIYYYKIKGIIITFIYILPLIINLFSLLVLSYYGIIISKKVFKLLFYKKELPIKKDVKRYIRLFIIVLLITIINTIFESYVIPSILSLLQK